MWLVGGLSVSTCSGAGAGCADVSVAEGDRNDLNVGTGIRGFYHLPVSHVTVVQYSNGNERDQQINAKALPILVQETITAQSADIDMVSGATVTSDGYLGSLQSALD